MAEVDFPLSKERIDAFQNCFIPFKEEENVPLQRCFHTAVNGAVVPLSWANLNGREDDTYKTIDVYNQEALSKLTTLQIHAIAEAISNFENSFHRNSRIIPTEQQALSVLSAAYHVFNQQQPRGKLAKDVIRKTAEILGIKLGGVDCLTNTEIYEKLNSLIIAYKKANAQTR